MLQLLLYILHALCPPPPRCHSPFIHTSNLWLWLVSQISVKLFLATWKGRSLNHLTYLCYFQENMWEGISKMMEFTLKNPWITVSKVQNSTTILFHLVPFHIRTKTGNILLYLVHQNLLGDPPGKDEDKLPWVCEGAQPRLSHSGANICSVTIFVIEKWDTMVIILFFKKSWSCYIRLVSSKRTMWSGF